VDVIVSSSHRHGIHRETSKYQSYHKQLQKQEDQLEIKIAQLPAENDARTAKGQAPWTEDDIRASFKVRSKIPGHIARC
jgi:hypothetical protein